MLGWFQALMPKEERFFDLFTRHAETVVAGAVALRRLLRGDDEIQYCHKMIVEREAEADEITRAVMMAVRRSFITPFDRSDIQALMLALLQHPFASGLIYGQGCEVRERFTRRAAVAGARRPRSMEGVRRGDCWARD